MPHPPLVEALLAATRALETLEIPYLIGGSMASSAYGEARSTQDVDVLADLTADQIEPLLRRLGPTFYADAERGLQAIARGATFNVIHLPTMSKIDIFVAGADAVNRRQLERRRFIDLPGAPGVALPIASPEDVIVQKLRWYRLGNEVSERQIRDVQAVLRIQGDALDWTYLREAARASGVSDLVEKLLAAREPDAD